MELHELSQVAETNNSGKGDRGKSNFLTGGEDAKTEESLDKLDQVTVPGKGESKDRHAHTLEKALQSSEDGGSYVGLEEAEQFRRRVLELEEEQERLLWEQRQLRAALSGAEEQRACLARAAEMVESAGAAVPLQSDGREARERFVANLQELRAEVRTVVDNWW